MMKELFPVVGPDGITRALLHYNILELIEAGIDQICLIVQPEGEKVIRDYFTGTSEEYIKRLEKDPARHQEALSMQTFSERIKFVIQHTQE
jgi:UTP--glucose-1-phosphate uridylyltransferase